MRFYVFCRFEKSEVDPHHGRDLLLLQGDARGRSQPADPDVLGSLELGVRITGRRRFDHGHPEAAEAEAKPRQDDHGLVDLGQHEREQQQPQQVVGQPGQLQQPHVLHGLGLVPQQQHALLPEREVNKVKHDRHDHPILDNLVLNQKSR